MTNQTALETAVAVAARLRAEGHDVRAQGADDVADILRAGERLERQETPVDQAGAFPAVRPHTLTSIACHLDARAVAIMRPDSQTYAEWQTVAEVLRRMADETPTAEVAHEHVWVTALDGDDQPAKDEAGRTWTHCGVCGARQDGAHRG
ncbi:hypothetical protein ACF1AE_25525 [Streptomyces sp. NPDC014986]|uniref:hypothetical protein n=1 Tax=Streptomyces sp. NPDC014986 TaxID=3364934 RepID=UPI0037002330